MRIIYIIFFIFYIFFSFVSSIFACQFDTSTNTYVIKGEKVYGQSYFHQFQIESLFTKNGKQTVSVADFFTNSKIITDYIAEKIKMTNNGKNCEIQDIGLIPDDEVGVIFNGLGIAYIIDCKEKITKGNIHLGFFPEGAHQTNILDIFVGDNKKENFVKTEYLFRDKTDVEYDLETEYTPSNGVGENVKNTNGNVVEDIINDDTIQTIEKNAKDQKIELTEAEKEEALTSTRRVFGDEYLQTEMKNQKGGLGNGVSQKGLFGNLYGAVLDFLTNYLRDTGKSIFVLFWIIFVLGFLHAAGPGHTKTVLATMMIDKKKRFKDGFVFISTYTFTHYFDILVFSVVLQILYFQFDMTYYIGLMQKISVVLLFAMSIFLIYKAFKNYNHGSTCNCCHHSHSKKGNMFLAFITGIVPCGLGWSILFLLFALKKVELIFPMMLALALGTFIFLLFFLFIVVKIKTVSYDKFKIISKYSPFVSGFFLLLVSFVIALYVF